MITRNENKTQKQARGRGTAKRFATSVLVVICAATLGSGFFFAARQHFSSMDFGMKNSRLRKQIDQLEAEKRRLILAREISMSPVEIKKAAKKIGLMDPPIPAAPILASADPVDVRAAAAKTIDKPLVQKTVAVAPVPAATTTALKKIEAADRPIKKPTVAR